MSTLTTTIQSVTVYPDRARILRSGKLRLEAGSHKLEISELPFNLEPASLRAAAHGSAPARLLGIQSERSYYTDTPAENVRQLEAGVEAAQDELDVTLARIETLQQYRLNLDALAGHTDTYAIALASGEISLEAQMALFDSLRSRNGQASAELQQLNAQKRQQERGLEKLKRQLDEQRSARPRQRNRAILELEVLQPGDFTIELKYVVSGAAWQPLYDLRLVEDGEKSTLEVGYLAQVTQQTGESWEGVTLELSTARPALAGTVPELKPWYIQPYLPPAPLAAQAPTSRPAPMLARANFVPGAAGEEPLPSQPPSFEAQEVTASIESGGASVTYTVPGGVDVPSDGQPHKVTVGRFPLEPHLDYVSAPRLSEAAYRRLKATNRSPYTFLAGQASLFIGDEFIGTSQVKRLAPNEELELYLGPDDRITVARELKRREVDKTLVGGRRRLHFAYEIRLESHLPGPIQLELHDQLPVSRHEDLKVRLDSADPKPAEQTELNLLNWKLTVPPGQKTSLRFDFTVEYPQAMAVTGLP